MKEFSLENAGISEGEGKTIEIEGKKIAVFNVKGTFFAMDNACPGDDAPLGEGFLDGAMENISCPWYGHSYNLKTGKSIFEDGEVRTYEVIEKNGQLTIFLGEK